MQITFAGTTIAQEPPEGGFDAVKGFRPNNEQQVQTSEPIRAEYAVPIARENSLYTLAGQIVLQPETDEESAMVAIHSFYKNLPKKGDLVLMRGNSLVTYSGAVLKTCEAMDEMVGVSIGWRLTFVCGAPAFSQVNAIETETGGGIETENGTPLFTEK